MAPLALKLDWRSRIAQSREISIHEIVLREVNCGTSDIELLQRQRAHTVWHVGQYGREVAIGKEPQQRTGNARRRLIGLWP